MKLGSRTAAMVEGVDLLPTFIEAAGGKPPAGLDGRSLLPLLEGRTDAHRDAIYATHTGDGQMNRTPMRCVRTERYKYVVNLAPEVRYTTHMDRAKDHDGGREYWDSWVERGKTDPKAAAVLRRYHERPREELYDLHADPDETRNLAGEPAQARRLESLRARLAGWRREQGDDRTGPEPLPAP